ncbi:hypothetical protein BU52_09115 [Streptomyces toyocaensis]|uniref:Uncharacterized protein n=1 Tax=Streptomyces toyocaensis TaxID=55952 RepID=A0A081XVP2_STRTO|nr:hypothetical protein BU52_09115 [Streptomyces toyocaensis]
MRAGASGRSIGARRLQHAVPSESGRRTESGTRLSPVGLVLLFLIGVWVRTRRDGLAVGAATLLTVLMIQA